MKTNIQAKDGHTLALHHWLPASKPTQVMIISHGMGEHIARYADFARACNQQGIAVIGANHRGHGPESTHLGHFANRNGWNLVLSDINCIIQYAQQTFSCKPILFGHSMGSFVARHAASKYGQHLSGLILCGSNHQGSFAFKAGKLMAKLEGKRIGNTTPSTLLNTLSFGNANKNIKPLRTDLDWLSRDTAIVDQYIADPYCGFLCTPQFWMDLLGGLNEMSKTATFKQIPSNLPIYIISGDADPISRYGKGVRALEQKLRAVGVVHVTSQLYPQARHELLNEINKQEVFNNLHQWIKRR